MEMPNHPEAFKMGVFKSVTTRRKPVFACHLHLSKNQFLTNVKKTFRLSVYLLACLVPLQPLCAASDVAVTAAASAGGSFSGDNPNVFTPSGATAVADLTTVQTSLNAAVGVTLNTASGAAGNGDLTISTPLAKSAGGSATLTLNAVRDLLVNKTLGSNVGAMPLVLTAGRAMASTASITSNGGNISINTVQPFALGSSLDAGSGQILLQSGSLETNAAQTVTASSVAVSAGAAWQQLGTINGNLSVAGTLSAAGPATGGLQVNGSLTLLASASTVVDLAGSGQGSDYDSITASGAVALDGALQLNFLSGFENSIVTGNTFTILSGASITGSFAGLPDGARIPIPNDQGSVKISYGATTVTLGDWQPLIHELAWDPGTADSGTAVFSNTNTRAGRHYFHIVAQATDVGAWKTRLSVAVGEADLYLRYGSVPQSTSDFDYKSERAGSDGLVLRDDQYTASQDCYIMINAAAGAQWSLFSGRAWVQDLGALSASAGANSGDLLVGPEGIAFFKTAVPANTPAWALWTRTNTSPGAAYTNAAVALSVRQLKVPIGTSTDRASSNGQFLVVPPYLSANGDTYFVSLTAEPATRLNLASYQQPVGAMPFETAAFAVALPANTFFYQTYQVNVPVQQIAWDLTANSTSGNLRICARRANAPNPGNNDALAEAPAGVAAGLTLVPPTLSDGVWYVTVYTDGNAAAGSIRSGPPIVTDISFVDQITNDLTGKSGWRIYRVTDINSQLGCLGWDLLLSLPVDDRLLAIRANAVPGRQQYRSDDNPAVSNNDLFDFSSSIGDLQRPAHQADVWYIGVYRPDAALGPFTLTTQLLTANTATFDAATPPAANVVTNQTPGLWQYFRVDVPADAPGWDLRLTNVTSGSPRLVVRRDQLPADFHTDWGAWGGDGSYPNAGAFWSSGAQWAAGTDLTGYSYEADGSDTTGRVLHMGMGNPLEPGTFYVGVSNNGASDAMSYTLESRGIGGSYAIPVTPLAYTGGSDTRSNLAPRELAYYKVSIPAGQTSWQVKLAATSGDVALAVRKDVLPNVGAATTVEGNSGPTSLNFTGGIVLAKSGDEHFLLLPTYDPIYDGYTLTGYETTLQAGDYYLAVVSQGATNVGATGNNLSGPRIGTGNGGYTLLSRGNAPTTALGTAGVGTDLIHSDTLEGGEVKFYSVTVPAGLASMQVSLENVGGRPLIGLPTAPGQLVRGAQSVYDSYGLDSIGSGGAELTASTFATLTNPAAGTYTLAVRAGYDSGNNPFPSASYSLRVQGQGAIPVGFDDGSASVNGQAPDSWRYFLVTVPADALGWDLRLTTVTSGSPRLVVRRDQLPASFPPPWISLASATTWPSGAQWAPGGGDLTGFPYDEDGSDTTGRVLHMGMGNPLEPGTYYIGVSNNGASDTMSYTLESRGIGGSYSISVTPLEDAGGSVSQSDLAPRELAYYKVTIPAGQTSWQVKLSATSGDVALAVQKDMLPNLGATDKMGNGATILVPSGGVLLRKTGDEHFLLLPSYAAIYDSYTLTGFATTIAAGDYYLAVVSQGGSNVGASGDNLNGPRIGSGNAGYTLLSRGQAQTQDFGGVSAGGADLVQTGENLGGGEVRFYTFTVPAGLASVQVSLENRSGNPLIGLASTIDRLGVGDSPAYGDSYSYGIDSTGRGEPVIWGSSVATLANPSAGRHYVAIYAGSSDNTFPDASYTLRVQGQSVTPVVFDGGTAAVAAQSADSWRYFQVTVPADALGWDLRLTNVTSGNPRLVVRRDLLPASFPPPWISLAGATTWDSGAQWAPGGDLTGYPYDADGSDTTGRVLHMGMGNPLQPGTYCIGVSNNGASDSMSYTLESRGIGGSYAIPVTPLDYVGGSDSRSNLAPRELAYYKVTIPAGQTSWQVKLSATSGDVALAVQKDILPNVGAVDKNGNGATVLVPSGGVLLRKAGDEHFLLLPSYAALYDGYTVTGYATTLAAGDYYLAVVSQGGANVGASGNNLNGPRVGTGNAGYTLLSRGPAQTQDFGGVSAAGPDLLQTAESLGGGEVKFYAFTVPAGLAGVQVSLESRTGNPVIGLESTADRLGVGDSPAYGDSYSYGIDSTGRGEPVVWGSGFASLVTPTAGRHYVAVYAGSSNNAFPDAGFSIRIHPLSPVVLNFATTQNAGNGGTNLDTRAVGDSQMMYYRVDVPASLDGQAVLGWRVGLALATGHANWRISQTFPPAADGSNAISASDIGTLNLTPPYLTPGTWYIQVQGLGLATYTLTSEPVVLQRPAWTMPAAGEVVTTAGLPANASVFADSGLREDGTPLPDPELGSVTDQGIDLANTDYHYYAVTVPENNADLLHAELIAINGTPALYARPGNVPSDNRSETAATLTLEATGTQYASWVPQTTRTQTCLTPGTWYLAVKAGGTTNARYRLRLAHGNPLAGGLVQDLPLSGGSLSGQLLAAGDLRFYRVTVPSDAPLAWQITYSQTQGDVDLFVRDSAPPGVAGDQTPPYPNNLSDWRSDNKNQGPYNFYPNQGTATLTVPPLRPGHVCYLGFYANSDANFAVSSATSGGTLGVLPGIDFYTGAVTTNIPANDSLLYQIQVPPDATQFSYVASHPDSVQVRIEQGTPPATSGTQHFVSSGPNSSLNQVLSAGTWPWVPAQTYYVRFLNTSGSDQTITFAMPFAGWAAANGLTGQGALPGADGDGSGLSNLVEYACNLTPGQLRAPVLVADSGTAGLPNIRLAAVGDEQHLLIEYLRRKNSGLTYIPQFSGSLDAPSWQAATLPPLVTPIDADWERVTVEDTVSINSATTRFGRISILLP